MSNEKIIIRQIPIPKDLQNIVNEYLMVSEEEVKKNKQEVIDLLQYIFDWGWSIDEWLVETISEF
jgi:hypothetical protein